MYSRPVEWMSVISFLEEHEMCQIDKKLKGQKISPFETELLQNFRHILKVNWRILKHFQVSLVAD